MTHREDATGSNVNAGFLRRAAAAERDVEDFLAGNPDALRQVPPMPTRAEVWATVRDDDGEGVPVARITFTDVVDEQVVIDVEPWVAVRLARDLITFVAQAGL